MGLGSARFWLSRRSIGSAKSTLCGARAELKASSKYPSSLRLLRLYSAQAERLSPLHSRHKAPVQPLPARPLTSDTLGLRSLVADFDDRVALVSSFPSYNDLSDEQKQVLHKVREGESVFFTGSAGTGKSVLLRAIIQDLGGPSDTVAVTASTGIAAVNIGGQTLHSFAGVGLGNKPTRSLVSRARFLPWVLERWLSTQVLIIDEVSMVSSHWFDVLHELAQKLRRNKKPFGGIQLVVCGDFFQLPPVPERDGQPAYFAFDSWEWDKCVKTKVKLTQVFRQKDPLLIKMLNDMRNGEVSEESAQLLRSLARPVKYNDGITPTEIVPMRWMADQSNQSHLNRLPGEVREFVSEDTSGKDDDKEAIDPERAKELLHHMLAPPIVQLKIGAQVMCIRNHHKDGIVNGSVGKVVDFVTPSIARSEPNVAVVSYLEPKEKDEEKEKEKGKGNKNIKSARKTMPESTKTLRRKAEYESTSWPLVEFEHGVKAMLGPVEFTSETMRGIVQAKRLQVPLILAWALTVHKAQGQTLSRVKINLLRTFEKGQAYVALSRCTSLEGLEVYNYSRSTVFASKRVQQWSKDLISFAVNPLKRT